jgi:PEP-CTERM motif
MKSRSFPRNYKTLYSCVALAALIFCFVSMSAPAARADDYSQSPTTFVDYSQVPTEYRHAILFGHGQFGELQGKGTDWYTEQWNFSLSTDEPVAWSGICGPYGCLWHQWFGEGGTFTLSGPGGLTFTGDILSGWSEVRVSNENPYQYGTFRLSIYGEWNDGTYSYALLKGYLDNDSYSQATLTFVPEPGSLVLLGSGALALAGLLRRKLS